MMQTSLEGALAAGMKAVQSDLERAIEASDGARRDQLLSEAHARVVSALREYELMHALMRDVDNPSERADRLCRLLRERYGIETLSFGYIGNCSLGGGEQHDDRSYRVFTPWKDETGRSVSFGHARPQDMAVLVENAMTQLEPWVIENGCRYGLGYMKAEAVAQWINGQFRCGDSDDYLVQLRPTGHVGDDAAKWTIAGDGPGWESRLVHEAKVTRGACAARAMLHFLRHFNAAEYWALRLKAEHGITISVRDDGSAVAMRDGQDSPLAECSQYDRAKLNFIQVRNEVLTSRYTPEQRRAVVCPPARRAGLAPC